MNINLVEDYLKPFDILVIASKDSPKLIADNAEFSSFAYIEGYGVRCILLGLNANYMPSYSSFLNCCLNKSPNEVALENIGKPIPEEWFPTLDRAFEAFSRVGMPANILNDKTLHNQFIVGLLCYIVWTKKEGIMDEFTQPDIFSKIFDDDIESNDAAQDITEERPKE
jgi:hypothetical protein